MFLSITLFSLHEKARSPYFFINSRFERFSISSIARKYIKSSVNSFMGLEQDSFYEIVRKIKGENAYLGWLEPKGKVEYKNGAYMPYGACSIQSK